MLLWPLRQKWKIENYRFVLPILLTFRRCKKAITVELPLFQERCRLTRIEIKEGEQVEASEKKTELLEGIQGFDHFEDRLEGIQGFDHFEDRKQG